jgi:hypothetical protein
MKKQGKNSKEIQWRLKSSKVQYNNNIDLAKNNELAKQVVLHLEASKKTKKVEEVH